MFNVALHRNSHLFVALGVFRNSIVNREIWLTFAKYLLAGSELTEQVIFSGTGVTGALAY